MIFLFIKKEQNDAAMKFNSIIMHAFSDINTKTEYINLTRQYEKYVFEAVP